MRGDTGRYGEMAPGEGTLAHSAPLRDKDHLLGFEDANGNLPAAVRHANKMADVLAAMCGAVLSRGGDCWVETSPSRGIGSAFPLEGRESHVGMLEHPSIADLAQKHGLKTLHFDQCMTRERPQDTPQKKTALLYSRARDLVANVLTQRDAPIAKEAGVEEVVDRADRSVGAQALEHIRGDGLQVLTVE